MADDDVRLRKVSLVCVFLRFVFVDFFLPRLRREVRAGFHRTLAGWDGAVASYGPFGGSET